MSTVRVASRHDSRSSPQSPDVELVDEPEVFRGRDRGARWTRISYGLYAARPESKLDRELRAWSLVLPPDACFTHLTAARLRGWWLPQATVHPVFAALRDGFSSPRRRGLVATRHRELPESVEVKGLRVTSGAETLLAAARDLGIVDLALMADSALRLGHTTIAELESVAHRRRRGGPMLRQAIPLLDPRSESPWESVMRVLHAGVGIEVEPQYRVEDHQGRFVARADLWIVGTRRLHEYDGAVHRDAQVHRGDLQRERRLTAEGWQRMGFTAADLLHNGADVIRSAQQALGRVSNGQDLRRWNGLLAASLFSAGGRLRAQRRWGCAGSSETGDR